MLDEFSFQSIVNSLRYLAAQSRRLDYRPVQQSAPSVGRRAVHRPSPHSERRKYINAWIVVIVPLHSITFIPNSCRLFIIIVEVIAQPKGEDQESDDKAKHKQIDAMAETAVHRVFRPIGVRIGYDQQMLSPSMMIGVSRRVQHVGHCRSITTIILCCLQALSRIFDDMILKWGKRVKLRKCANKANDVFIEIEEVDFFIVHFLCGCLQPEVLYYHSGGLLLALKLFI